jgi:hypothetical protein
MEKEKLIFEEKHVSFPHQNVDKRISASHVWSDFVDEKVVDD